MAGESDRRCWGSVVGRGCQWGSCLGPACPGWPEAQGHSTWTRLQDTVALGVRGLANAFLAGLSVGVWENGEVGNCRQSPRGGSEGGSSTLGGKWETGSTRDGKWEGSAEAGGSIQGRRWGRGSS